MDRKQAEEIYNKKKKRQKKLLAIEIYLLALLYQGIVKNRSKWDLWHDFKVFIKKEKVKGSEKLAKYCINQYSKLSKAFAKETPSEEKSEEVYKAIEKEELYIKCKQLTQEITREEEAEDKRKLIQTELKENREEAKRFQGNDEAKIFYVASRHGDCAEDHIPYQGKIYVDEKWRELVKDKRVEDFIASHEIKTFQWVTGAPAYLFTRPNCRHYFKTATINDFLSMKLEDFIQKYGLDSEIGTKIVQTYRTSNDILEKYKERLAYHKALNEKCPNELLRNAIKKDEFLIRKWKSM